MDRRDLRAGGRSRGVDWIRGAIATLYAAGMLYAGGAKFLLLSALLYAPGTFLFVLARREQKHGLHAFEWPLFAVSSSRHRRAYGLATGTISI